MNGKICLGKTCWILTALMIAIPIKTASSDYIIKELPRLPGGSYITPTGINNNDIVVGKGNGTDVMYENAIKWVAPYTTIEVPGPLPGAPDNFHQVYAISDNDILAGHSRTSDYSVQAVIWNGSEVTMLPKLPKAYGAEGVEHEVYGITPTGTLIVGKENYVACMWEKIGGNWTKTLLPSTTEWPYYPLHRAEDVNNNGVVVGWNGYLNGLQGFPTVWEKIGGTWTTTWLPLVGHAQRQGAARAINNLNQVAGYIQDIKYGPYVAVRWEKDINSVWQKTNLHNVTLGYTHSFAQDINDKGVIVGTLRNSLPNNWLGGPEIDGERAFIYDPVNGMQDLTNLIDSNNPWILTDAKGINENGTIVGLGLLNGQPAAFILLPTQSPMLEVSPANQTVNWTTGQTTLHVDNSGTEDMIWSAQVVSGNNWLTIASETSGINAGTITLKFSSNITDGSRTGTIRVIANGATNSPKDITVTQPSASGTVVRLSPLAPSGTYVMPVDLNNSGIAAGKGNNPEDQYSRCAVRITWDEPRAMTQDLTPLPNSPDRIHEAFSVNNSGIVVGLSRAIDWSIQAVAWEEGLPIELPRKGIENQAFGINNMDQVVGFAGTITKVQGHAVLWEKREGSWHGIQLPTYNSPSWNRYQAHAINEQEQIVGWSGWATGSQGDPVVWEKIDETWQIEELSNGGSGSYGSALAINNAGIIAGYRNYGTASHAVLWQKMGDIWQDTDIHNWNLGYTHSLAYDINRFGVVVGTLKANLPNTWGGDAVYVSTFIGDQAFIYDPINGMRNLNSFLPVESGWILKEARAINDDGWIVGTGEYNGQTAAFLFGPTGISSPNPDVTIQLDLAEGTPIDRRIIGHHYTQLRSWEIPQPTFMRGINAGINANLYGWKDQSGIDNAWGATTLSVLQQARDKNWLMLITANCQGTGIGTTHETFQLTDTHVSHVTELAADWVRYINYTLQTFRQGSAVSGQDQTLLNSITWNNKLLAPGEAQTDKVMYWQIGNEIDTWWKEDYRNRYVSMTTAMLAQDPTIKVGPSVIAVSPSQTNHGVRAVLQDTAARVDFFTYHPYDNLETAWGNISRMELELQSIADYQQNAWTNVRNTLIADGRNPNQIELFATEWNPSSAAGGVVDQSMYQALGIAETVFTFANLKLSGANYWLDLGGYQDATQKPSYKIFANLRRYFGRTLVNGYNDGNNFRLYVTKDGPNDEIVLWGLNFSNTADKTVRIQLSNFGGTLEKITLMKLGSVAGDRSLMQFNDYSGNSERIDWQVADISELNAADFTLTFQKATVTALVLVPRVTPTLPGDANKDGMVDVGDLGILAANYGTASGAAWEQGDFNGDGAVDVGDLGILAANYGTGVNATVDFNTDYAKAFETATDDVEEDTNSTLCSGLGLSIISTFFFLFLGIVINVKLKE